LFYLKRIFFEKKNFTLIEGDFLKKFNKNHIFEKEIIVFGSIPYYITTDIIEKIFISDLNIKDSYLIIQKDVLNRIFAKPFSKEYGYLTILVNTFSYPKIIFEISKNFFYPKPNVDSVMIKLSRKKNINFNKNLYNEKLKFLFSFRRKLLKSNLKKMGINEELIHNFFKKENINELARIEELDIDKIILLLKKIIS